MKKHIALNTRLLNQVEFIQLISSSLDNLDHHSDLDINSYAGQLIEQIRPKIKEYRDGVKQQRHSKLTKPLHEAKQAYYENLIALRTTIRGYRYNRNEEKKQAYTALNQLFKQINATKRTSTEEMAGLASMLIDRLKTDLYQAHLKTLMLEEFYTSLVDNYTEFYSLYLQRSKEGASKPNFKAQELRKKLENDYRLLYNYLSNTASIAPASSEAHAIKLLNDIRKDYLDNRKSRKTPTIQPVGA